MSVESSLPVQVICGGTGDGMLIVDRGAVALIAGGHLDAGWELWAAIGEQPTDESPMDESPIDGLLDHLARQGLRHLPSFAMAQPTDTGYRVLVRGDAAAVIRAEGQIVELDGSDAGTWIDRPFERVSMLTLGLGDSLPLAEGGSSSATPPSVLLVSGVATASSVIVLDGDVGDRSTEQPQSSGEQSRGERVGSSSHNVSSPNLSSRDLTAADALAGPIGSVNGHRIGQEGGGVEPARTGADHGVDADADTAAEEPAADPAVASSGPAQLGATDRQVDDDGVDDDGDAYHDMFGVTVHRSVAEAAVRQSGEGNHDQLVEAAPEALAEAGTGAGPDNHLPAHDGTEGQSTGLDRDTDIDSSSVTWSGAEFERQFMEMGDHDGHTMSLSELKRMREQANAPAEPDAPAGVATGSGVIVQSARCVRGHDNPPNQVKCGDCGAPLPGTTVSIPRPTLGRLRFSTGDQVDLDRPVLVGRKPDLAGRSYVEIPRELRIAVGDGLSRNHALFLIEGWQVRIEDLGSTNHTTVTLPGREPQRLRSGEPLLLTVGSEIDLGGEVQCRYES